MSSSDGIGRLGRRALVRIAWRQAFQEKVGTLLLIAVVALLAGGFTVGATAWESSTMSTSGYLSRVLGPETGAYVEQVAEDPVAQTTTTGRWRPLSSENAAEREPLGDVLRAIDDGEIAVLHQTMAVLIVGDRSTEPLPGDQLAEPAVFAFRDVAGRMPRTSDEVALETGLATRLGVDVGDTVDVLSGEHQTALAVTGVLAEGTVTQGRVVLGPGALGASGDAGTARAYLPAATELSAEDALRLNRAGAVVTARNTSGLADTLHPASDSDLGSGPHVSSWLLLAVPVAAAACLGLLLLPAFAVRAVRQQHLNGLLLSVGATDRTVTAVASAYAAGIALAGLAAGLALGLLVAVTALLRASGGFGSQVLVSWPILALLAAGVLAGGWLAGRISTLRTRRVPVSQLVAAGLGEQQATQRRRHPYLTGVLAAVTALVSAAALVTGDLLLAGLGVGLISVLLIALVPALVGGVDRLVGRGPITVRIAVRSLFRNRQRSVAGVRVVAAGAMVVTIASVLAGGAQAATSAAYQASMPAGAVRVVLDVIPGIPYDEERAQDAVEAVKAAVGHDPAATARVMNPTSEEPITVSGGYVFWAEDLPLLDEGNARFLAADHAEALEEAARRGAAVVGSPEIHDDGALTLSLAGTQSRVPATYLPGVRAAVVGIPPAAAADLGQPTRLRSVYFDGFGAEQSDLDRIRAAAVRVVGASMSVMVELEDGPELGDEVRTLTSATVGLGVVSAVVSLLISLLASAESRREWEIMNANGASVRQLRRVAAVLAGCVALVGGIVGVLGGLVASAVYGVCQVAAEPGWAYQPPWLVIAILVVAVPFVCATASGLTAFRRDSRRVVARHR